MSRLLALAFAAFLFLAGAAGAAEYRIQAEAAHGDWLLPLPDGKWELVYQRQIETRAIPVGTQIVLARVAGPGQPVTALVSATASQGLLENMPAGGPHPSAFCDSPKIAAIRDPAPRGGNWCHGRWLAEYSKERSERGYSAMAKAYSVLEQRFGWKGGRVNSLFVTRIGPRKWLDVIYGFPAGHDVDEAAPMLERIDALMAD